MRPLVEVPSSNEEYQELIELLLANAIRYREKQSSFLTPHTLWVEESDYAKAAEIASSVAARHTKHAKAVGDREWKARYKGSYFRGLLASLRNPANLFRLLLLAAVAGAFLIYPLIYILRHVF